MRAPQVQIRRSASKIFFSRRAPGASFLPGEVGIVLLRVCICRGTGLIGKCFFPIGEIMRRIADKSMQNSYSVQANGRIVIWDRG